MNLKTYLEIPPETDRSRAGSLSAEGEREAGDHSQGDALQFVRRRQTVAANSCSPPRKLAAARSTMRCRSPARWNASTPTRSSTTISRAWTTTISGAVAPTCHKVFGDGIAVLAGDALLTIAFEIVSRAKPSAALRPVDAAARSRGRSRQPQTDRRTGGGSRSGRQKSQPRASFVTFTKTRPPRF